MEPTSSGMPAKSLLEAATSSATDFPVTQELLG
jgi:hypothetical protein